MCDKKKEFILWSDYNAIRDRLEGTLDKIGSNISHSVSELSGLAFSYVAARILSGESKMPETSSELYKQLLFKARSFIKDEFRARSRSHGVRSIRPDCSLDKTIDYGKWSFDDAASMDAYHAKSWEDEHAYRCSLTPKVFEMVLDDMRTGERNRKILRDCMLSGASREAVAKRYGTARRNVDVLVHRCKKVLAKYGPGHYRALCRAAA